jgi:hypothetical protein
MPGNEHTVSEHSKTPGSGGATTSSDTAISDIAISDTAIVDPVVTALAELQQNARPSPLHFSSIWPALRMEISYELSPELRAWHERCGKIRGFIPLLLYNSIFFLNVFRIGVMVNIAGFH